VPLVVQLSSYQSLLVPGVDGCAVVACGASGSASSPIRQRHQCIGKPLPASPNLVGEISVEKMGRR